MAHRLHEWIQEVFPYSITPTDGCHDSPQSSQRLAIHPYQPCLHPELTQASQQFTGVRLQRDMKTESVVKVRVARIPCQPVTTPRLITTTLFICLFGFRVVVYDSYSRETLMFMFIWAFYVHVILCRWCSDVCLHQSVWDSEVKSSTKPTNTISAARHLSQYINK